MYGSSQQWEPYIFLPSSTHFSTFSASRYAIFVFVRQIRVVHRHYNGKSYFFCTLSAFFYVFHISKCAQHIESTQYCIAQTTYGSVTPWNHRLSQSSSLTDISAQARFLLYVCFMTCRLFALFLSFLGRRNVSVLRKERRHK